MRQRKKNTQGTKVKIVDELLSEKEQIDQMRTWWSEYGNYVIAGVVLGAAVLFGFNHYQTSKIEAQVEASTLYNKLTDHVVDGNIDAAEAIAAELAADYGESPYTPQSKLAIARMYMDKNRDQDAADALSALLDSGADDAFKNVARIRLAKIYIYQDKAQAAVDLLKDQKNEAFDARFADVVGDAYVALGKFEEARTAYQKALAEPTQAATVDKRFVQLKLVDMPIQAVAGAESADDQADDQAADEDAE